MTWVLVGLAVALLLILVVVTIIVGRARREAVAERERQAADQPDAALQLAPAALVRELRPSFARSVQRLKRAARGIDFRYGVPWYLLIGPEGSGKTSLVSDGQQRTMGRGDDGSTRAASSIGWYYFDGGVVIDVAASLALPGTRGDLSGWRALLQLLKRYRPRRPADGVIVAVPASLLLDDSWKARVQDLGGAIRERLALAQSECGFALPVYVIVTQADQIRGFSAFSEALPDNLQQDMLGWSNPHAPDLLFQGSWVSDGFADIHRGLVHTQVELFATSPHLERASALFLFSGEVQKIAAPLRVLLEEIFRPTVYEAAFFFRGFYLSGRAAERLTSADGVGSAVVPRSIGFIGDLLDRKVFPERGLAAPLSGTSVGRNRVSLAAQVAAAVLAVVLVAGTYWNYQRLDRARVTHAAFFKDVAGSLNLHTQVAAKQRTITTDEQIAQGFSLLQAVERLSVEDFHSVFFPASRVRPIEPAVAQVLTVVFGHLILPDFRLGLEERGRAVFGWTPTAPSEEDTNDPVSPVLDDSRHYRALKQFALDYRSFVDNYFRYSRLMRDETGDLTDLAGLGNYLTGRSMVGHTVPDEPYGRALRLAVASPVDCRFAMDGERESLVRRRASELLGTFGASWFGDDNPVIASENDFAEQWGELATHGDGNIHDLIASLDSLSKSVTTWASFGGRSGELRVPVFEQAPYKRIESPDICAALAPDLSGDIDAIAKMRNALSGRLTLVGAEPFGAVLKQTEKGLALEDNVQMLKTELDAVAAKDFWATLPESAEGVMPSHATWRPEAVDQAVSLFDSFDKYRSGAFNEFEPAFRRPLVTALTSTFTRGLSARLSFDAQEAPPLPSESSALLAEVSRLSGLVTKLDRLVPLFQTAGGEQFGRELVGALQSQSVEALQRYEQDATAQHPHVFGGQADFILNAWADVQSESATPAEALKRWSAFTDEQRESLHQYVTRAAPLVRFLSATHAAPALTRRWTAIVDDVAKSDQKLAGNGFGALDSFLRDGVPNIVPEKECAPAGAVSGRSGSGFFIGVRNDLIDGAVRRCRDQARVDVRSRYTTISKAFARLLAGKFPFSVSVDGARDAMPADIVEFLRTYDRQNGRTLAQQIESRSCSEDAAAFVRRIDALYPILAPARELQTPAVALDVTPDFRINTEGEIGGNQIAEWQIEIGRQTIRQGDPPKPVRWISGDPVHLVLRFAKDSPERPRAVAPFTLGDARTVRYDFTRGWGLFALLRAGQTGPVDLMGLRDPTPNVLKFEIPVERDPTRPPLATDGASSTLVFRVFMRVRLFQPGKADPLVAGDFPPEAPAQLTCPVS